MKISRQEGVQRYNIVHVPDFLILEYHKQNARQAEVTEHRWLFQQWSYHDVDQMQVKELS